MNEYFLPDPSAVLYFTSSLFVFFVSFAVIFQAERVD
jgi:hypothetical protein